MKALAVAVCLAMAAAAPAFACSFNTDCDPGSTCVKQFGELDGVCVGGMSPGNRNDDEYRTNNIPESRRPATDYNGTYGNTCSFNTDCGPGYSCMKSPGSLDGVCMRR